MSAASGGRVPAYLQELVRHWWVLPPTLLGVAIAAVPFYTAGLFFKSLEEAFGWTRAMTSAGHLALYTGIAASAPFVGRFLERFGARRVALFSMLSVSGCYALLASQPGVHVVFLGILLLLGLLGTGASAITMTRIVSSWFDRARGLALGLALTGSGVCGAVVPALVAHSVGAYGWRGGYWALAALVLASTPLVILLKEGPLLAAAAPAKGEGGRVLNRPAFWLLALASAAMVGASTGLAVHIVPMFSEFGFSLEQAAALAGLMGLVIIAGRLVTGFLLDHLPPLAVAAGLSLLGAAGYLSVIIFGEAGAPVLALANGLLLGAEYDVMSFLAARYFGLRLYGRVFGLLTSATAVAAGLSPLIIGSLFDVTGGYSPALVMSTVLLVATAPAFWLLGQVVKRSPVPA